MTSSDNFIWELTQFDGTSIDIPPEAVEMVKKRMDAKEMIHTSNGSFPANQIKSFRRTERRYGQQLLAESAAQAFSEPMFNEEGDVAARWVKKEVPSQRFHAYYSKIPAYRVLSNEGGLVTIAFLQAIHLIDQNKTPYCTENEVQLLTNR